MIKIENKYYVCSADIRKAAIDSAHQMGIGGWRRQTLSSMLKNYSMMMDEISAGNMIPWTSLSDWKKDSDYLRSDECLNEVMAGVEKALEQINSTWKKDNE